MASSATRLLRSFSSLRFIAQVPFPYPSAHRRALGTAAASTNSEPDARCPAQESDDAIYMKQPSSATLTRDESSVSMPMAFMTGSIVGKRFYKEVTTRLADDGNGWTVMLDYRTLKTPSKRPLKLWSLALAKAIAAEWDYQQADGIRPFTMPLMKLACTALERVPLTRAKVTENLMSKFHQDLVFCRSPGDTELTKGVLKKQEEKIDPVLDWLQSQFGIKPVVYSSFLGGKQDDGLTKAVEDILKKTTDFELAAVDAMTAAAHSLVIPLGVYLGRLGIEEAVELTRLEEDLQVERWGLVEGGHDVDIADLKKMGLAISRPAPGVVVSTPLNHRRVVRGAQSSMAVKKRKRKDDKSKVILKEEAARGCKDKSLRKRDTINGPLQSILIVR